MDAILEESGSCGRFQTIHVILTQMPRLISCWSSLLMVFGNYKPPWRCGHDQESVELEFLDSWNKTIGRKEDGRITGHENQSGHFLNVLFNGTCEDTNRNACSGIEFHPESSTIVSEFDLICDQDWVPLLLISVSMLGEMAGCLVAGQVGESFGRKMCLYSSTAILAISCGLSIISVSWEMYAVIIFFIGFGVGGILVTSVVHGMEFLNSWWRAAFGSVPFWNIALAIFSVFVLLLKDWRYIHTLTAVAGFLSLLGVFWVPESVRWLVVNGHTDKAEQVLKRIAVTNKQNVPLAEDSEKLKDVKKIENNGESKTTYLDLFRTKRIAFITARLALVWTFIFMSYYAMNFGISALSGDFYINFVLGSLLEIPPILLNGFLANWFGRKKSTSLLMGVSASCCLASALCRLREVDSLASTVFVFAAKGCVFAAWCAFTTLAMESFPTVIRNLGYGFLSMISRVGGLLCPLLIPRSETEFIVCYVIISCGLFISIFILSFMKETKDRMMENVMADGGDRENNA